VTGSAAKLHAFHVVNALVGNRGDDDDVDNGGHDHKQSRPSYPNIIEVPGGKPQLSRGFSGSLLSSSESSHPPKTDGNQDQSGYKKDGENQECDDAHVRIRKNTENLHHKKDDYQNGAKGRNDNPQEANRIAAQLNEIFELIS
jgi:hypothetical protein